MRFDSPAVEHAFGQAADPDWFPVALLQLDAAGRILGCNAAWREAMEGPPPGAALSDYVHPEDRGMWRELLQRLSAQRAATARERLRFVHPGGGLLWFDVAARTGGDGCCAALTDVTGERRRQTSLQAHLRSVRGLLDSIPGLIYRGRNNRLWTMEFVSAGCEAVTGYPKQWFLDNQENSFGQLIVAEDADYVWGGVQEALAGRGIFDLRYRICCADGEIKRVWETGVGIYSASGEVLGVEGAIFEVRRSYLDAKSE
jgi:PAS domain-containing protein